MARDGENSDRNVKLSIGARREVVKRFAAAYQKARKKGRGEVLDAVVAATGYSRAYASFLLRWHGKKVWLGGRLVVVGDARTRVRRKRRRIYDAAVVRVLKQLWELEEYACGKRLAAAIPALLGAMEAWGELAVDPAVRAKLLRIAPATIDRLLASERKRLAEKPARSSRLPTTNRLAAKVPVRTSEDWQGVEPGEVAVDLVAHDGGDGRGEVIQTLTLTDVATGWTVFLPCRNKAQKWVKKPCSSLRASSPSPCGRCMPTTGRSSSTTTFCAPAPRRASALAAAAPTARTTTATPSKKTAPWCAGRWATGGFPASRRSRFSTSSPQQPATW